MSDLITKCEVCQALIDEEDLFCANCGTEAPDRSHDSLAHQQVATHNFQCDGCGASMSYDARAGTLRCPFCGSERLQQQKDAKVLSPEKVVPFVNSQEEAIEAMRKHLGNSFWRPGDLAQTAAVIKMTAVYVPYWVFQATTHTYWTADTSDLPWTADGDWRPLFGEHRGQYAGILVGASGALTQAETQGLCPFYLSDAVDPADVDLENVIFETFHVMRKYARPAARQGLENLEAETCRLEYVPRSCRNMQVNTRIENLSSQPILLPIWIMAYQYRKKQFRFLVNGQTNKTFGEAPVSSYKIGSSLLLVILLILFFAWLLL